MTSGQLVTIRLHEARRARHRFFCSLYFRLQVKIPPTSAFPPRPSPDWQLPKMRGWMQRLHNLLVISPLLSLLSPPSPPQLLLLPSSLLQAAPLPMSWCHMNTNTKMSRHHLGNLGSLPYPSLPSPSPALLFLPGLLCWSENTQIEFHNQSFRLKCTLTTKMNNYTDAFHMNIEHG